MRKNCLVVLIAVCVLTGCIGTSPKSIVEVRPGVYVTNDASALPLPTSGYDIYLIGELHGTHETHQLFLDYLKMLHEANGLQDIVLEAGQVYEREANKYVLGLIDDVSESEYKLSLCSKAIVLGGVRALNETLPDDEKIRVHLVDVDYEIPAINAHLQALKEEIGPQAEDIQITWWNSEDKMLALVDQLAEAAGDRETVLNELETVRSSIRCHFHGGLPSIREERIAANIQYVLRELDGAPVLALYDVWHARKTTRLAPESQPWAERLTELGIKIYSVFPRGISGFPAANISPELIQFTDGTTMSDIFDSSPDYDIVYVDLRLPANKTIAYSFEPLVPLSERFDGIILFREVTPIRKDNL